MLRRGEVLRMGSRGHLLMTGFFICTPGVSPAVLGAHGSPLRNRAGPTCINFKVTPTEKEIRFGGVPICKV